MSEDYEWRQSWWHEKADIKALTGKPARTEGDTGVDIRKSMEVRYVAERIQA